MKTAVVLGVNGQDGSYLAEILLGRGYRVTGVGLQEKSRWVQGNGFSYVSLDIADFASLDGLLSAQRPAEIYHMAAIHGAAGYSYDAGWRGALAVNVGCVHVCLEHIRNQNATARLFYPSSLKAFGDKLPPRIDEAVPRVSSCLYGITKNAATELIQYYRSSHGVWAAVGYYFNHDSPRRPSNYFLPRLAGRIAARLGRCDVAPDIATLDFWCDWGSSREFMTLTADLVQLDGPQDVVFATGEPVYAAALAAKFGAAIHLRSDDPVAEPVGAPPYRADVTKLRGALGRIPEQKADDVLAWILRERYNIEAGMAVSP